MLTNWNILIWEYQFQSPYWLLLLVLIPIYIFVHLKKEKQIRGWYKFSRTFAEQQHYAEHWVTKLRKRLIVIDALAFSLLIIAFAQPYKWETNENIEESYKKGIDIVLAVDVSLSMYARDFEPNRLEVTKAVAKKFVDDRFGDKIGLVVFSGEAYTACPTTLDYELLKEKIDEINGEELEAGTAIGIGLATATARLNNDSIKSKVVILLTDGSNNAGDISPKLAAEIAKAKDICVYTIGVGTRGQALSPVPTPFGINYEMQEVDIDEQTLTMIADKTGGKYFRATDLDGLVEIYNQIDKMEKQKLKDRKFQPQPFSTPEPFLNCFLILFILTTSVRFYLFKWDE